MPINFQVPMQNAVQLPNGNITGICMSISAFWIQCCRQLNNPPNANDTFFTNWEEYETMAIAFTTILGDYNALTGGDAQINSQQRLQQHSLVWHDQFFGQLNLPSRDINWGTMDTLAVLISIMDAGPNTGYILTGYSTQGHGNNLQLNAGHTVAFWYENNDKTFMDPNFGQYTIARNLNWTNAIINHLQALYGNFNQWVLIEVG